MSQGADTRVTLPVWVFTTGTARLTEVTAEELNMFHGGFFVARVDHSEVNWVLKVANCGLTSAPDTLLRNTQPAEKVDFP
jgi:hypothetical protein